MEKIVEFTDTDRIINLSLFHPDSDKKKYKYLSCLHKARIVYCANFKFTIYAGFGLEFNCDCIDIFCDYKKTCDELSISLSAEFVNSDGEACTNSIEGEVVNSIKVDANGDIYFNIIFNKGTETENSVEISSSDSFDFDNIIAEYTENNISYF